MRFHFEKVPGQDVGVAKEDPSVVIYAEVPDTVRLPGELGGCEVRVTGSYERTCPGKCGRVVRCLGLANGIDVAECRVEGFLWFRPKSIET